MNSFLFFSCYSEKESVSILDETVTTIFSINWLINWKMYYLFVGAHTRTALCWSLRMTMCQRRRPLCEFQRGRKEKKLFFATRPSPKAADSYVRSWGHCKAAKISGKLPIWGRHFCVDSSPRSQQISITALLCWAKFRSPACKLQRSSSSWQRFSKCSRRNVFTYSCSDLTLGGLRKHFPHQPSSNFYCFIPAVKITRGIKKRGEKEEKECAEESQSGTGWFLTFRVYLCKSQVTRTI